MNASRVALPKTYHQRASCGTRCFKLGPIIAEMPSRSSSHRHVPIMSRFIASVAGIVDPGFLEMSEFPRSPVSKGGGDRNFHWFDLKLPVCGPHVIPDQRLRRRPGSNRSVRVVNAAVAGTHEQICVLQPTDWASQMCAVHRERGEFGVVHTAKPKRALCCD